MDEALTRNHIVTSTLLYTGLSHRMSLKPYRKDVTRVTRHKVVRDVIVRISNLRNKIFWVRKNKYILQWTQGIYKSMILGLAIQPKLIASLAACKKSAQFINSFLQ